MCKLKFILLTIKNEYVTFGTVTYNVSDSLIDFFIYFKQVFYDRNRIEILTLNLD